MSRLQTGSLVVSSRPVGIEEIVTAAVTRLPPGRSVDVEVPETLPRVEVDPGLLERAVANLIDNAVHHSPLDTPVRVDAKEVAGRVHLRVVDRGPGIPDRE